VWQYRRAPRTPGQEVGAMRNVTLVAAVAGLALALFASAAAQAQATLAAADDPPVGKPVVYKESGGKPRTNLRSSLGLRLTPRLLAIICSSHRPLAWHLAQSRA